MRLQIAIVTLVVAAFVWPARRARSDELAGLTRVFADSENNYVLTGAMEYTAKAERGYSLSTRALVDGISSASTKVGADLDQAYVGGFSNRQRSRYKFSQPNWRRARYELSASGGANFGENETGVGYIYSWESIYESHTVYARYLRHLAQRNASVSATWYHNFDSVLPDEDEERADELGLPSRNDADGVSAAFQQALSRTTVVIVSASGRIERGVLESPERDMRFDLADGIAAVGPERLPDERTRAAGSVRLSQYLRPGSAVHGIYQYDLDEWGTRGHSVTGAWYVSPGQDVLLRLRVRYHTQSPSDYSTLSADIADDYYSGDPRLQGFSSWLAGARLAFGPSFAAPGRTVVSGGIDADLYYQTPRDGLEQGYYAPIVGGNVLFQF